MRATTDVLPEPATRERAGWKVLLVLSSLVFGINATEAVSNNLLPLTLRRFTADPRIIGLILAINPAFGFIAQPLVGLLSDRMWTRLGRRAVFLITGAPVVAACLVLIPLCPTLAPIVVLVVVYQFFEDVLYGSDHPLVADLTPPEQRTFVLGLMSIASTLSAVLVLKVGMRMVDNLGEYSLYWLAAALQIAFVCVAAFFLNEKPVVRQKRPPLTPARYLRDVTSNPILFRLAIVQFLASAQQNAVGGFVALYATKTLLMSKTAFGDAWVWGPVVTLACALPVGWVVERFAKQYVLFFAFAVLMASYATGYFTNGLAGLTVAGVLQAFGGLNIGIAQKAFMTEYIPRDIIGQVTGALNIFYAVGRTLALIVVPWFVFNENYRIIWICGAVLCAVNLGLILTIRDLRHERRRQERSPSAA